MRTRPVWILPDNATAEYPFVQATPNNKKGLLIECQANISPVTQNFAASLGSGYQTSKIRRINIVNNKVRIRPSTVGSGSVTLNGTTTYYRTLTNNAFVFIKKPTMIYTSGGAKSTEFGPVTNPYVRVDFSDKGVAGHTPGFGFRYTDNPTVYYTLSTENDYGELFDFETNWFTESIPVPVAMGKKINFAITDDWLGEDTVWTPYSQEYYVGARMEVSIDMNGSMNPADHTVVFNIVDIDSLPGFTTLDVPSWVIGPDTTRTGYGWQGYIEYSDALAALGASYDDFTPADNF
jgi:hypothetical protein